MKSKLIASLLASSVLASAAPVFASGFGPASHFNPATGAPASQRGPSELSLSVQPPSFGNAYGGTKDSRADSGARTAAQSSAMVFAHH